MSRMKTLKGKAPGGGSGVSAVNFASSGTGVGFAVMTMA